MTEIQRQIIDRIRRIRAEHHACTAGAVARELGVSKTWVIQQCDELRRHGVIDWTTFAGSLHLVDGRDEVADEVMEVASPEVLDGAPGDDSGPAPVELVGGDTMPDRDAQQWGNDQKPVFVELDRDTLAGMSQHERSLYYGRKGAATREANKLARLSHG